MEERTDVESSLNKLYEQCNNSTSLMLQNVFHFLLENDVEFLHGSSNISGEHLINQIYSNNKLKYLEKCNTQVDLGQHILVDTPPCYDEVEVTTAEQNQQQSNNQLIIPKETDSTKDCDLNESRSKDKSYSWTQTIEDLELKITVPKYVRRGKQMKVTIETNYLNFSIQTEKGLECLLTGKLPFSIRPEETMWTLHPGQHVLVTIEKLEHRWWDRLLEHEEPINLDKMDLERDLSTMPQDEQAKIHEIMFNHRQKHLGQPTSDVLKMQNTLQKAWNIEGSPFKGQPFDPSIINFSNQPPSTLH